MLKNSFITALVLSFFAFAMTSLAEVKEVEYTSNMTCGGCKSSIEKALGEYEGIESYNADVTSNTIKVKYDDAKTNDVKIQKVINKAGYKADKVAAKKCDSKKDCSTKCSGDKKMSDASSKKDCSSKCSGDKKMSKASTKESCCGKSVEIKNASLETK